MNADMDALLQSEQSVAVSILPAIFTIFDRWGLTGTQQAALLGLSNKQTLNNWKKQPEKARLSRDLLERASYILGIYKVLQTLLSDQSLADRWLSLPNDNPVFNGCKPINRMLAGLVVDLSVVRDFLLAEQQS